MTPNALKIALDLPLVIQSGSLDKLVIKIPWTDLGNCATVLDLDGLHLVAHVNENIKLSQNDKHKAKQKILDSIESQREAKAIGKAHFHKLK